MNEKTTTFKNDEIFEVDFKVIRDLEDKSILQSPKTSIKTAF